jgi:hypothetical protein
VAQELTLTNRQLLALRSGLNSLDAIKNGKDGEFIPLEFESVIRNRLMRAEAVVASAALVYDKTDRKLAEEAGVFDGMDRNDANGRKMDAYKRKIEAVLDEEVKLVGIVRIKLHELLHKPLGHDQKPNDRARLNPIPQSVLYKLAPIIEEEAV